MNRETNVPRIRFKGFKGGWKSGKLSEYLSVCVEKNGAGKFSVNDVYSVSREFGVVNQIAYQGRSFAGASLVNYRVIRQGQVAYTKSPLRDQPFGIIKTNKSAPGILSALYGVYDCLGRVSTDFVQTYFEKDDRLNAYLRPLINKGAKNTILVSDEDAIAGDVIFPARDEQISIAAFFSNLDKAIAAARARVEKLRLVKKSMLVKMFPQGDKTEPKIRFKGFCAPWKRERLATFLTVSEERNAAGEFGFHDVFSVSREFGVINQIQYQGRSFAGASLTNYRVVRPGQVVYTKSPLKFQPYGIIKANKSQAGIVSALYGVYDCKENASANFIQIYFEKDDRLNAYLRTLVNKGAKNTLLVSDEDAISGHVVFPSLEEQQKIGAFFSSFDALLRATERRVVKLRQVKSALLERMFV